MSALGFHVWSPEGNLPTVTHPTFLAAVAEADRLKRANPGSRFVVMAPIEDMSGVGYALGFSRGREEGLAQAHREIMKAEANADRHAIEARELRSGASASRALIDNASEHQAAIADCILWFDGFTAAHSPKESWERPHVPNRDRLTALNGALQRVLSVRTDRPLDDQDIPF